MFEASGSEYWWSGFENKSLLCPMGKNYTAGRFLIHLMNARRWDAFHSPFLFEVFTHCCDEHIRSSRFEEIESLRKELMSSSEKIRRMDAGAGSEAIGSSETTAVADIARHALSHPFQCRFLYRLALFLQPKNILELGTSLGISTAYLAAANPETNIVTVEGDPNVAQIAGRNFQKLNLLHIDLHTSLFRDYLDSYDQPTPDLIFMDGHHESSALLTYYDLLKNRFQSHTIIVVDDIYWSKDMTDGWNELIARPEVTQSVDCFHFGLLFFNSDFFGKEHHKIKLPLRMLTSRS